MIDVVAVLLAIFVMLGAEVGQATYYAEPFFGRPMANGDTYTPDTFGVAHKMIPLGTVVVVVSRCGAVTVEVTDRGPYGPSDWIVDVSPRVAERLFCGGHGYTAEGVAYGMERVMVIGGWNGQDRESGKWVHLDAGGGVRGIQQTYLYEYRRFIRLPPE